MTDRSKKRKMRSPEDKLIILKRHLLKGEKISDTCEDEGISPSQFYGWQQALFENGALALNPKSNSTKERESKEVQQLKLELDKAKARLTSKHEVLSELMSEYIELKKNIGD